MRLLFYINIVCLFFVFCVNTMADNSYFYYPFLNFDTVSSRSSSYSGSLTDLNTYLEDKFSLSVNVRAYASLDVASNYKTTIFSSNSSYWFLVNHLDDNTIISAIKFFAGIGKEVINSAGVLYETRIPTLLDMSSSSVFYFEGDRIDKYLVDSDGNFSFDTSLTINSSWELSLIDDTFPELSSLYLVLSFDLASSLVDINSLITNLNLAVFGIAGDDLMFTVTDFASTLTSGNNCDTLDVVFLGHKLAESTSNASYNAASQLNSSCSSLSHVFFISVWNPDSIYEFNQAIINDFFAGKQYFWEF